MSIYLPVGDYTLLASASGYTNCELAFTVTTNENNLGFIKMNAKEDISYQPVEKTGSTSSNSRFSGANNRKGLPIALFNSKLDRAFVMKLVGRPKKIKIKDCFIDKLLDEFVKLF